MLVWEGFRRRSGRGLCRFDASMRRFQTQEWLRFVQVWLLYKKDSDARVSDVCAVLILVLEGFRYKSEWGLRRFDASMGRIETQEWARFVQVCCLYEKDSNAGFGEVCASLMQAWEGFRRKNGWSLCRFDACIRRIQTHDWRGLCSFDARMRRIQTQEWGRFVQVWFLFEKDSDSGMVENCAGLMQVWEGFRRKSGWGLRRFDASMGRIQTQEWVKFVQVWCLYEKDSDAGVGEVCAGLMHAWEGFRRKREVGLCRFDTCLRRIQTQEWLMFAQVWCKYEKDSDARVDEVCAGLMLVWEGFSRRCGWGMRRFDSSMRRIQTQEWLMFV